MNHAESGPLAPGLYMVATPIGAARDITLRALDVLATADVLAAEDTRTLRHLMELHGLSPGDRPFVAYHDHNGPRMRPRLIAALTEGKSVAYASEAGTPLIADPGYQLVRAAIEGGHKVFSAPGPSAVLAALTVSGLPTDRFVFAGFAPPQAGARKKFVSELAAIPATLVLYESPKRVHRILGELAESLGKERQAVLCRELTKKFEEVRRGTLSELLAGLGDTVMRGEVVILIDRARGAPGDHAALDAALTEALRTLSRKDAAAKVATDLGLPRRVVYQAALERMMNDK